MRSLNEDHELLELLKYVMGFTGQMPSVGQERRVRAEPGLHAAHMQGVLRAVSLPCCAGRVLLWLHSAGKVPYMPESLRISLHA